MKSSLIVLTLLASMPWSVFAFTNRKLLEISDSGHPELTKSVAAIVPKYLQVSSMFSWMNRNPENILFKSAAKATYKRLLPNNLCEAEKSKIGLTHFEQNEFAVCTAFLIGEDTLATAGHCFFAQDGTNVKAKRKKCDNYQLVFNFTKESYSTSKSADKSNGLEYQQISVKKDDLYTCSEVVGNFSYSEDWAIIKLKKPVVDKVILKLNTEYKYTRGEEIYSAGYPLGTALKVSEAGFLNRTNFLETEMYATLLNQQGMSGAPIFNMKNEVIGILTGSYSNEYLPFIEASTHKIDGKSVRINQDQFYDLSGQCDRIPSCQPIMGQSKYKCNLDINGQSLAWDEVSTDGSLTIFHGIKSITNFESLFQ
ncbi:MAG: serine protease [Bacteriovoracaceae bacterium]